MTEGVPKCAVCGFMPAFNDFGGCGRGDCPGGLPWLIDGDTVVTPSDGNYALVAQRKERRTSNAQAGGSNPPERAN